MDYAKFPDFRSSRSFIIFEKTLYKNLLITSHKIYKFFFLNIRLEERRLVIIICRCFCLLKKENHDIRRELFRDNYGDINNRISTRHPTDNA